MGPSSQAGVTTKDHLARAVGLTDDSTLAAAGDCCVADFAPAWTVLWSSADFRFVPKTQHLRVNEYAPFCNGPGDVKSPRVIVTPPSSCFCPWLALRPPHYAVRRNGEPI